MLSSPAPDKLLLSGLPLQTINLLEGPVAVAGDTSRFYVVGNGNLYLRLAYRVLIMVKSGILAVWRVH